MKSFTRSAYASGTSRRLVADLIRRGWFPGCRISDLKPPKSKSRRMEAAGIAK